MGQSRELSLPGLGRSGHRLLIKLVVILMILRGFVFVFVWFSIFSSCPKVFSEFQSHLSSSLLDPLRCLMEL